jgi:hypothetical protein
VLVAMALWLLTPAAAPQVGQKWASTALSGAMNSPHRLEVRLADGTARGYACEKGVGPVQFVELHPRQPIFQYGCGEADKRIANDFGQARLVDAAANKVLETVGTGREASDIVAFPSPDGTQIAVLESNMGPIVLVAEAELAQFIATRGRKGGRRVRLGPPREEDEPAPLYSVLGWFRDDVLRIGKSCCGTRERLDYCLKTGRLRSIDTISERGRRTPPLPTTTPGDR